MVAKFKLLLFLLFLGALSTNLQAQSIPKNPNLTDKDGKRQGKWTILYDNNQNVITDTAKTASYRLISYQNDKPIGKVTDHYRNGIVQMEATLLSDQPKDVLDGLAIYYDEQGKKTIEAIYKNGTLESEKSFLDLTSWLGLHMAGAKSYDEGDYKKTQKIWEDAKKQAEKEFGKEHTNYAFSCNNLAHVYNIQGFYALAEPLLIESKEIRKKNLANMPFDYAQSCNNLASLYLEQGFYDKAEPFFLEAKILSNSTLGSDHPFYALLCNNLAILYLKQNLNAKAEALFIEVKNIREKNIGKEHPDYARSCNSLSGVYQKQGLYNKAESLCVEAMDIRRKLLGKEHPAYANSCNNLAGIYKDQGFYTKSESLFIEAKNIYEKVFSKQHPEYAQACNNLANLYQKQRLYAQAEPYCKETIENKITQLENLIPTFSEKERIAYFKSIASFFTNFQDFTLAYYKQKPQIVSELYNQTLLTKGIVFASTQKMRKQILNSGDSSLIKDYDNWKTQKDAYNKLLQTSKQEQEKKGVNLDKLASDINDLERNLSKRSTLFADNLQTKSYTWQQVQEKLGKNEVVVEIIRTLRTRGYDSLGRNIQDTVYVALFVTPKTKAQPDIVILENGKELETTHLNFYKNTIQFTLENNSSYSQYWQPIAEKLKQLNKKGFTKIYFSPDGVYHQISLNTLKDPKSKKFLLESQNIQLLGSSRDLIEFGINQTDLSRNFEAYKAYLLGFPIYNLEDQNSKQEGKDRNFSVLQGVAGKNISLLPGTKAEIEVIKGYFNQKNISTNVFIEANANEENVKSFTSPTVLHVATHGFFIPAIQSSEVQTLQDAANRNLLENPFLRSGLLLSGCENPKSTEEDGILTAEEAMNLSLENTELVVLSACETGLGDIQNGEGVFGLQRAFQQAGAKTILMSLWKVSDEATQLLMSEFYKNLLAGKSKRDAFKAAQLTLKQKYPEPYFWGAFVMAGE
ncbi:MAG: CHAT domain-containing protein [Cytophagales bacterium]|nr:MAG: CHAT domain-containing protein [Cytophagales bacterium]TAF59569.1 MAG: CHAT domain-containing protein [Cytophagales bacterium]